MVPTRTNVAAGIPSSKVKYSKLFSTDTGHIHYQKETSPAEASFKLQRCVVRSHLLKFKKSSTKIPYKAVACATAQFLIGTFLVIVGCLLLAGYISKVGVNRAVPVVIVGILVFLPGFYHLLIAYRAHRSCQGYSYSDLPDCDE
ncbi:transmembrane protein 230-like [Zalophus californianus]|uniref:Transmembrane protein 230 n=1 Tax=Zalophus californianus TaxID=9704 RepID=A0A6P9FMG2_ZALCA|nr:transmembrane protein 230-like [Zalophus californianus]